MENAFLGVFAEYEMLPLGNAKTDEDPVHRKVIITDLSDKTSNEYGRLNYNLLTTVPTIETALHVKVKALPVPVTMQSHVLSSHTETRSH